VVVDEALGVEFALPLQSEGWPGAVTQQALVALVARVDGAPDGFDRYQAMRLSNS
jgi:hypothetical protein